MTLNEHITALYTDPKYDDLRIFAKQVEYIRTEYDLSHDDIYVIARELGLVEQGLLD